MLWGWVFALYFHMFNGVRHLLWDAGYGLEIRTATVTGWLVVVGSVMTTLVTLLIAYINWGLSVIH